MTHEPPTLEGRTMVDLGRQLAQVRRVSAETVARLEAERDEARAHTARTCAWTTDDDDIWHTACGQSWEFTTGGPRDNSARFCLYCGGSLVVVSGWVCACTNSGPVKVDEDGCCAHCGEDARFVLDVDAEQAGATEPTS